MKQSSFKNFVLFKPRTKYVCRQCHCTYPVYGDTWIECLRSCKAVDGKKAFRIFWLCHSGHRQFRGYSKPVSWKKNLGGDVTINAEYLETLGGGRSFAEEEDGIEQELKEMEDFARRMRNSGGGKSYSLTL